MNIPNNNLTEMIKDVVSVCDELSSEYGKDASWFLPPASESEIIEWENERKIKIPESYKEWLLFSNGSQILNNTAQFYGLKHIGINDEYIHEDYIVIGELIGDGELLCFSKTTGKIIRYNHGKAIEYQSFKEVLNLILNII
jgi:hypothetical protein